MRFPAFLLLFALAAPAAAQTVYRYVTPDGRTIFSDQPVPGAKLQGTVTPPAPPSSAPAAGRSTRGRRSRPSRRPTTGRNACATRPRRWKPRPRRSRRRGRGSTTGKEPLPGERTGTATGGSRLNEAYWARQAANEEAVAKAQARLDAAVAARNAAL